jgi:hypothetical protein
MNDPKRKVRQQPQSTSEPDFSEFTQEIDSPLGDLINRRDEPTLSQIAFDEIELALDS